MKVCATADERAGALQDAAAPSLNSSASASRSGATAPKRSEGGQPGTLNFLLAVRGGLRPEVQADGHGVRFLDAQGAAALTYSELTVLDADGRRLPARFEAVEENQLGSRGRESAHSSEEGNLRRLTSAATESLRLGNGFETTFSFQISGQGGATDASGNAGGDGLAFIIQREALQRGLAQAQQVLIVADGALWIWKLALDRFPHARQQLDLWHAEEHLCLPSANTGNESKMRTRAVGGCKSTNLLVIRAD